MQNTINSDLIRGNIDTIILKSLFEGDRYGYDIINEIEQKSSGQYIIKQPTLYSCLKRLEVQGFIKSYWGAKTSGGRRKYYTLTDLGRELFIKNQTEWEYSRTVIDKLISDKGYDMSQIVAEYRSNNPLALLEDVTTTTSEETSTETTWTEEDYDKAEEESDKTTIIKDSQNSNIRYEINYNETIINNYNPENPEQKTETVDFETVEVVQEETATTVATDTTADTTTTETETVDTANINLVYDENKYIDTTSVLDKLFSEHLNSDNSYTGKLENEQYEASARTSQPSYSSEDYFNDVYDSDETYVPASTDNDEGQVYTEKETYFKETHIIKEESTYFNDTIPDPSVPLPSATTQAYENVFATSQAEEVKKEKSPTEGFLSYKSTLIHTSPHDDKLDLERDYRKILFTLLKDQTDDMGIKEPVEPSASAVESETQMQAQPIQEQPAYTPPKNKELERSIDNISSSVSELGENIYIRTHSPEAAKEHSGKFYYYCNRLMVRQYALLFAIMGMMTCFTFLVVRVGLGIFNDNIDLWCYIMAIIGSAAFPLTAAYITYRDPDKRRLINYRFHISIRYRLFIFLNLLVIIYCVNIYLGMPLGFSADYTATLLLPALLSLCVPINGLIFHNLFTSGKYSVK